MDLPNDVTAVIMLTRRPPKPALPAEQAYVSLFPHDSSQCYQEYKKRNFGVENNSLVALDVERSSLLRIMG